MSSNPSDLDAYYSPQALASRQFALDLAQLNLKAAVLSLLEKVSELEMRVKSLEEEKTK